LKKNNRNTVAVVRPYTREEGLYRVSFGTGTKTALAKKIPLLESRLGKGNLSLEELDNGLYAIVERQAFPRSHALWRAQRIERSLWGLARDTPGAYTSITADRERMRSLPVAVEQQPWTKQPGLQPAGNVLFIQGLRQLREDTLFPSADVSVAVYDHNTSSWAILYDATKRHPLGSMVKVPVALAEERLAELGYTENSPFRLAERLRRRFMLMRSSNFFSNSIITDIGGTSLVENALRESYPGVFSSLTLDERIPDDNSTLDGRTSRNKDSALGVARWHILLHEQQDNPSRIVYSSLGWGYSKLAQHRDLLSYIAQHIPFTSRWDVRNKTGTDGLISHDAGTIITPDGLEYSIAVMLQRPERTTEEQYSEWKGRSTDAIHAINLLVQDVLRDQGYVRP
jgi:hypothetical protein